MSKVYVDVIAEFSREGTLTPKKLRWRDGRIFEITRVTEVRRACSFGGGGCGMRYTCYICGYRKFLFYDDSHMWFVEGKESEEGNSEK